MSDFYKNAEIIFTCKKHNTSYKKPSGCTGCTLEVLKQKLMYCDAHGIWYSQNAPCGKCETARLKQGNSYERALGEVNEQTQSDMLGRSLDSSSPTAAMTSADKEKLQRLFDVMKKRIEKSDKYFRFFAGLNLQYHSIEDQKKYLEIMREWKADLRGKKAV